MAIVFFSYSHRDDALRDELEIHLSALKRQGLIDTWHDRRIGAGEEIDHVISEHLERADIILLLVSPYFIASDYCYDVEMKRAIARHEAGEARVIPVILHPCDWHGLPFGKLMATPTDGKPVSMFPNQHAAFLDISQAIRKATEEVNAKSSRGGSAKSSVSVAPPKKVTSEHQIRSSNLRVKKKFTDIEKDRFLNDAYEYIAKFFEGSLSELRARNEDIESDFRRIDANHFVAAVLPALSGRRGWKRLKITLAWITPVNPLHRAWRRADMWFNPLNDPLRLSRQEADWRAVMRGTVQHEIFEGERATAFIDGDNLEIQVNCRSEDGTLDEVVPYSLIVTLEVAEDIGVPIYDEVRVRIHAARIGIASSE